MILLEDTRTDIFVFSEAGLSFLFQNILSYGNILVVFHNLRGYDSHLIMQAIGKVSKQIKCIPNNMGCMDFIDSFQFMSFSLEKLVKHHSKHINHGISQGSVC
jgi:hypothetical protein